MPTCSKCKKPKPREAFSLQPRKNNGLSSWCKKCSIACTCKWRKANAAHCAKYIRKWQKSNSVYLAAYQSEWRKTNPEMYRIQHDRHYKTRKAKLRKARGNEED